MDQKEQMQRYSRIGAHDSTQSQNTLRRTYPIGHSGYLPRTPPPGQPSGR